MSAVEPSFLNCFDGLDIQSPKETPSKPSNTVSANQYRPRIESPAWFTEMNIEDADCDILRHRGAFCFRNRDYTNAKIAYETLLTRTTHKRSFHLEILDALVRCECKLEQLDTCWLLLAKMENQIENADQQACLWKLARDVAVTAKKWPVARKYTALLLSGNDTSPNLWHGLSYAVESGDFCRSCRERLCCAFLTKTRWLLERSLHTDVGFVRQTNDALLLAVRQKLDKCDYTLLELCRRRFATAHTSTSDCDTDVTTDFTFSSRETRELGETLLSSSDVETYLSQFNSRFSWAMTDCINSEPCVLVCN